MATYGTGTYGSGNYGDFAGGGPPSTNGTIGSTQDSNTGAFVGTITAPSRTGTISSTQDNNTGAFVGYVSNTTVARLAATSAEAFVLTNPDARLAATSAEAFVLTNPDARLAAISVDVFIAIVRFIQTTQDNNTGQFVVLLGGTNQIIGFQDDNTGQFIGAIGTFHSATISSTQDNNTGLFVGAIFEPVVGVIAATQDNDTGTLIALFIERVIGTISGTQDSNFGYIWVAEPFPNAAGETTRQEANARSRLVNGIGDTDDDSERGSLSKVTGRQADTEYNPT